MFNRFRSKYIVVQFNYAKRYWSEDIVEDKQKVAKDLER